jgi:hypothetical protein
MSNWREVDFGIDEGQIEPFLTRRGFQDVRNADAEELGRLYLTGPNAGRAIGAGVAIASARVIDDSFDDNPGERRRTSANSRFE